ncbi:MAG TPA: tripartite tricarboxylate transporter substrate binding protein [Candidatus Saccharimonadales bacterium]|nr:tripartite tricarboxylate transporter substrate binding protein [Candidatus Saccharimonadales bacterium]
MRKQFFSFVAALILTAFASAAHAQSSMKMMIPANPGGGWDQTGRNLATAMQSAKLVSSVQFDNKGGAGGTIGLAQFINSAKGDPNAVMIGGMVMVGAIYLESSPVNLSMVTPLARLTGEYEIIVVQASSPYKTMGDLVKAFKANPGSISWGGGSAGGTDHILAGLIAKATGVDAAKVNYVPFKGGGEAIAAIVGGHVTAGVSGIGEFSEQIKGGRMRALAVSSPSRVEGFHTLKEQGIDVDLANWRGIFGAPGITTAQRDALIKIVRGATESASWKTTVEKLGWSPIYLAGDPFKKYLDEDTKRVATIIDSLGIKSK